MIRRWLSRFLYGRNGPDTLYNVCLWTALALSVVNLFLHSLILEIVYLLLFGYAIFRLLSRNIARRRKENEAFRRFLAAPRRLLGMRRQRRADREHVYKRCPHCKSQLRFPREKGKHTVCCPRCGATFSVKI